ncbi:hypothetical protein L596_029168 [Steinernema carpocapsae]|uniref:Uncharacterized protein n=1 Tax=Steinernema carpocapsae TaxID=34508 RepID=A0A4U5LTU9_STECR|nr:hypothetical protein L596_029168 [Steinernema carpocapsae]
MIGLFRDPNLGDCKDESVWKWWDVFGSILATLAGTGRKPIFAKLKSVIKQRSKSKTEKLTRYRGTKTVVPTNNSANTFHKFKTAKVLKCCKSAKS